MISGESATLAEPELRIAYESGVGAARADQRYDPNGGEDSEFFSSHLNTAIHEEPGDVAQASGRAGVRVAAHGRHDEVPGGAGMIADCADPGAPQWPKRRSDEDATNQTRASQRP